MSKHELIIKHIGSLPPGSKISVRRIAHELHVSEGTAYRAIKEAEKAELVKSIPRVGTVRIERPGREQIERLTYADVVNIVDGVILGGRSGLHKTLNKFLIGAMEEETIPRYIKAGNLLIVGNREGAQRIALERGAGVLISGGFSTSDEIRRLADEKGLPLLSSTYDTYTVATLINRAIYDRLIKKEVRRASDIMAAEVFYLTAESTVGDWRKLLRETKHSHFPVVDGPDRHVIGIATTQDIAGMDNSMPITEVMTKNPITIAPETSVAYAAHLMVWEGIELLPVVEGERLVGVVSRTDVMKALQERTNQPQAGETINDVVMRGFREESLENGVKLVGEITPIMMNQVGAASCGAMVTLMTAAGQAAIRHKNHLETSAEHLVVYFLRPIQIDSTVEVIAEIMDAGRRAGKVDISVVCNNQVVARGMMTVKVLISSKE